MPETPDWTAAPQAPIANRLDLQIALESGPNYQVPLGVAGKHLVIAGVHVAMSWGGAANYEPKGGVLVIVSDWLTGTQVGVLSVSPESPVDHWTPPFGSIQLSLGADLALLVRSQSGTGATLVWTSVDYLYQT